VTAAAPQSPAGRFRTLLRDLRDAIRGTALDYTRGSLGRAVLLLSVPMILEMVMESVFAVVDVYFVSSLGSSAVATVGLTESILTLVYAVGIGLSMGALLGVGLAQRHASQVCGLVLLSASFELTNPWAGRLAGMAGLAARALPDSICYLAKGGSDIADPIERAQRPAYDRIPFRGLAELVRLQRRARVWLPSIGQPVLAIHARQDHTAPLSNPTLIEAEVSDLRTVVLEDSYHVVTVDREKERVAAEVSRFVDEALGRAGSRD
jgi:esterase/lipase